MANTANYGWTKPDVGGSQGTWGTILNALADAADASLKVVNDLASAALAKAGGVMTGRLDALTATMARVDKGAITGPNNFDLAAGQYFTMSITGAMAMTMTNKPAGAFAYAVILVVTNGAALITWPVTTLWAGGVPPTLTAAGTDVVVLLTHDNGVTWRGFVAAKDIR